VPRSVSAGKGRGIYYEPSLHLARYLSTTLPDNGDMVQPPFLFETAEEF